MGGSPEAGRSRSLGLSRFPASWERALPIGCVGDVPPAVASVCWLNYSGTAAEVPERVPMRVWDGVLASLPVKGETLRAILLHQLLN